MKNADWRLWLGIGTKMNMRARMRMRTQRTKSKINIGISEGHLSGNSQPQAPSLPETKNPWEPGSLLERSWHLLERSWEPLAAISWEVVGPLGSQGRPESGREEPRAAERDQAVWGGRPKSGREGPRRATNAAAAVTGGSQEASKTGRNTTKALKTTRRLNQNNRRPKRAKTYP